MAIATTSDTTRIFIDRARFVQAMTTAALQGHLNDRSLNAEVFEMAGRIVFVCLTATIDNDAPALQHAVPI